MESRADEQAISTLNLAKHTVPVRVGHIKSEKIFKIIGKAFAGDPASIAQGLHPDLGEDATHLDVKWSDNREKVVCGNRSARASEMLE